MVPGCIAWLIYLGLYILFAGQVSLTEVIAAVPAAAASACFTVLLHRVAERRFSFRVPWWRIAGQPLLAVIPDAVRVGRVLVRALLRRPTGSVGVVASQPFRSGGDDPLSAARRGLVTLGSSLAPNGYVVGIPDAQNVLLLHRLMPVPPDDDQEWPL